MVDFELRFSMKKTLKKVSDESEDPDSQTALDKDLFEQKQLYENELNNFFKQLNVLYFSSLKWC